jgi:hypothetical protein
LKLLEEDEHLPTLANDVLDQNFGNGSGSRYKEALG